MIGMSLNGVGNVPASGLIPGTLTAVQKYSTFGNFKMLNLN